MSTNPRDELAALLQGVLVSIRAASALGPAIGIAAKELRARGIAVDGPLVTAAVMSLREGIEALSEQQRSELSAAEKRRASIARAAEYLSHYEDQLAEPILQRMVDAGDSTPEIQTMLGTLHLRHSRLELAAACFEVVHRADPTDLDAMSNLALSLWRTSDARGIRLSDAAKIGASLRASTGQIGSTAREDELRGWQRCVETIGFKPRPEASSGWSEALVGVARGAGNRTVPHAWLGLSLEDTRYRPLLASCNALCLDDPGPLFDGAPNPEHSLGHMKGKDTHDQIELEPLHTGGLSHFDDAFATRVLALEELRGIERICWGGRLCAEGVARIVDGEHFPRLSWLDLGGNGKARGIGKIIADSPVLGQLTALGLDATDIDKAGIAAIVRRKPAALKALSLGGARSLSRVLRGASGLQLLFGSELELEWLDLRVVPLDLDTIAALNLSAMARSLRYLKLTVNDEQLEALLRGPAWGNLEALDLRRGNVCKADWAAALDASSTLVKLRYLNFDCCDDEGSKFTAEAATALANCSKLANLDWLGLAWCFTSWEACIAPLRDSPYIKPRLLDRIERTPPPPRLRWS